MQKPQPFVSRLRFEIVEKERFRTFTWPQASGVRFQLAPHITKNKRAILTYHSIVFGGEGEIRTLEPLLTVTRFPIVRARPATRLLQIFLRFRKTLDYYNEYIGYCQDGKWNFLDFSKTLWIITHFDLTKGDSNARILSVSSTERCPSGLRSWSWKPVTRKSRGFESHSLRQITTPYLYMFRLAEVPKRPKGLPC